MKKKQLLLAVILLVIIWGLCVWHTNRQYPDIPEKIYKVGEWVELGNSRMEEMDSREGYSLRVESGNIISTDDYIEKYASVEEKKEYEKMLDNYYLLKPEKIYLVKVTLKNSSDYDSTEKGVNWSFFYLYDKNIVLDFETVLYKYANRSAEGSPAISLKAGTEKEFFLPYGLYEDRLGKNITRLEEIPFCLIVSSWPTRNLIKI